MSWIQQAYAAGARIKAACEEAEISLRTYRCWFRAGKIQEDQRPLATRPEPKNKLSEKERQVILEICSQAEYASLPPSQIVPALLDKGIYLGSEATFYRVLSENDQLHHRGRNQAPKKLSRPTSYTAKGPNEVWSWDITYLASRVKGQFYYLYMHEDIYSRKLVGYEVHERECGEKAAELVQRCMLREQCFQKPLVLHSDNGAPMKAQTMKAKLEELKILPSYSRPRVSNDNPFSEAVFRTLKYRPNWPSAGFESLSAARDWVENFVSWYNDEHKHSSINFVTPGERHAGLDGEILANRKSVLEAAKARTPGRWSGEIRNCEPAGEVMLNPDRPERPIESAAA